ISPFPQEHRLIRTWCAGHGLDSRRINFIARPSQEALPELECEELDFVLIDGDHAFPAPFIDWYFVADRIRKAGGSRSTIPRSPQGGSFEISRGPRPGAGTSFVSWASRRSSSASPRIPWRRASCGSTSPSVRFQPAGTWRRR